MGKLYIMMGQPGSGKSTWVANHLQDDKIHISRDTIRFSMVEEDKPYFSKENEVFDKFVTEINKALKNGYTVFADATHLNKASRTKVLRKIRAKRDETNVIWIKTSLKTSLERNERRKGTRAYVPEDVIKKMYKNIEEPTEEEGINKVFCIDENNHIQEVIIFNHLNEKDNFI